MSFAEFLVMSLFTVSMSCFFIDWIASRLEGMGR